MSSQPHSDHAFDRRQGKSPLLYESPSGSNSTSRGSTVEPLTVETETGYIPHSLPDLFPALADGNAVDYILEPVLGRQSSPSWQCTPASTCKATLSSSDQPDPSNGQDLQTCTRKRRIKQEDSDSVGAEDSRPSIPKRRRTSEDKSDVKRQDPSEGQDLSINQTNGLDGYGTLRLQTRTCKRQLEDVEETKKSPESPSESSRKRRKTSADVQLARSEGPSTRVRLPRAAKCQLKKGGKNDTADDTADEDSDYQPVCRPRPVKKSPTRPHPVKKSPTRPRRAKYPGKHNCHECQRMFSRSADLWRHIWAVHEQALEVRCPWCSTNLSRPDALKRHKKRNCSKREM